jgi:flagellin-like protein
MKGISEIITMVMIILIIVSLTGMLYIWVSGMFTDISSSAKNKVDNTKTWAVDFKIGAAKNVTPTVVTVIIRNIGSAPMNVSRMNAYVDDTLYTISGAPTSALAEGGTATFNVTGVTNPLGRRIKIMADNGLMKVTSTT